MCVLMLLCVLILLHMCPHTIIYFVLILLYVSPYYIIFVLILPYLSSYYHMCPHTTMYLSSYYRYQNTNTDKKTLVAELTSVPKARVVRRILLEFLVYEALSYY
jgi:hypothetical protein